MMKQILDQINLAMKRPEKPEKSFICSEDLKRIWADRSAISTLLHPDKLSPDQIDSIQSRMIIILSILISIGAKEFLTNFHNIFFDHQLGVPLWTDDDIPFPMDQLTFFDRGSALSQLFYTRQFRFKPVVIYITRKQRTQLIENHMERLPFVYRETDIGEGSYGRVDHVEIPPRYIEDETGLVWDRVSAIFNENWRLTLL